MNDERKKRFTTPGAAWEIVEGPGKGKTMEQFAEEERKKKSQLKSTENEKQQSQQDGESR